MKTVVKNIALKSGGLTMKEAIALCAKKGIKITVPGLRHAAKNHFFMETVSGHSVVDKTGLDMYIDYIKKPPPIGWVTISSMQYLGRNLSHYYKKINEGHIDTGHYGREMKRYARKKDIERIFG